MMVGWVREVERASEDFDAVKAAIKSAWEQFGEVPFPLYDRELEELAKAALRAMAR